MSHKFILPALALMLLSSLPAPAQDTLPDGPGKKAVESYCVQCHDLGTVTRGGYDQTGWRNNVHMMVNVGSGLPPGEIEMLVGYLAKNFPERPKPKAVLIPGSAKVAIREWVVPTPGSRPHDPRATADGAIWYTGQFANVLGRLDPKTGALKLVTAPTPKSRPYGMVVSSKGVPFFVEFGSNKIARIDPDTMAIREYALPSAESRPRRVAITSDDVLWYSDYARGYLGRFDPATGKHTEWASPGGPKSQPYGIAVVKDVVWYSEAGVQPNTLVRFDPGTEKFQTWAIPSGGGVVRNVDVTRDGNLALALSGVNRVALVELK
ncbi:MAG TPA: hypothetical protein VGA73_09710 [Candidatus Binatia bacterium]